MQGFARKIGMGAAVAVLAALAVLVAFATPARAQGYSFTRVADSAADGFDPFSFECSAINNRGDIAFRTARAPRRGAQVVQGSIEPTTTAAG
jgi:hypothetical protein